MSMKRIISLFHFLLLLSGVVQAQKPGQDSLTIDIAFYADIIVNAGDADHRQRAHDSFTNVLSLLLSNPSSFSTSLDSIPWISVVHGNGFRMITWQHRINDETYQYGGYIQWPDKIVTLQDSRPWVNGASRNIVTPGTWYGALYYKLYPFTLEGKEYYILFGFNAENSLINTKVADILDLSGPEPRLGMPLFIKPDDAQSRLIITYADASPVQLFYDPQLNAIVHDHLEHLPGVGPSGESLPVSDGSQEAWVYKDGKWIYVEEVYDVKSEEPPMSEERKDRKEDKDILGRPKG